MAKTTTGIVTCAVPPAMTSCHDLCAGALRGSSAPVAKQLHHHGSAAYMIAIATIFRTLLILYPGVKPMADTRTMVLSTAAEAAAGPHRPPPRPPERLSLA